MLPSKSLQIGVITLCLLGAPLTGCRDTVEQDAPSSRRPAIIKGENLWKRQARSYPESREGLRKCIKSIFSAKKRGKTKKFRAFVQELALTDADNFFKYTFKAALVPALTNHYKQNVESTLEAKVGDIITSAIASEKTRVRVFKIKSGDDSDATPLQKKAFSSMTTARNLWTVTFVKDDEEATLKIWSFVYIDGGFRLIGDLSPLRE